ncbi:unnamed protein product [Amaranthus hypochondriacus]
MLMSLSRRSFCCFNPHRLKHEGFASHIPKKHTMNLNSSFSHSKPAQPQMSLTSEVQNLSNNNKNKVVFIMGATGTGKSRLSIDLANDFSAEIINCDKYQFYKGYPTLTNKNTEEQRQGVPHHLLGIMDDPNADYNATDFRNGAVLAIESITRKNKLPIIVGGPNSFIEALVNDDSFKSSNESCFLWLDVSPPILQGLISKRVDQMVESGLVDEVRGLFDLEGDYTRGIRRAIGVTELDRFLRAEKDGNVDKGTMHVLLEVAIDEIKKNKWMQACRQVHKIHRLRNLFGWDLQRIDATEALYLEGTDHSQKNRNNGSDHKN